MTDKLATVGCVAAGIAGAAAFLYWQNYGLRTSRYIYSDDRLPESFRGFKILQISDYHNTTLLHSKILNITRAENRDIIVITGDLIDCRHTDEAVGLALVEQLVKIAPVYYVRGNHEAKLKNTENIVKAIADMGVNVIENKKINLQRGTDFITLMGVKDPQFYVDKKEKGKGNRAFRQNLLSFAGADNTFKVLLSHRPEFIHTYRDSGINLAITGHAHGGQFGIPFTDIGVFVPNQGLFPPFAAGMKNLDDTTAIISRGIGNSVFPFRLFNRPEIVTIEFE